MVAQPHPAQLPMKYQANGLPERPNGAQLRKLREHLKMTQGEFGALVFADARCVSLWERNVRNMRRDTWELLLIRTGADRLGADFFAEYE